MRVRTCFRACDPVSELPGVQADVTDLDALARAVDEAAEQMGGIDLLVANEAVSP
ncbi:hypothetical protein [Streptomyces sp. NPDC051636]|uniref:hypothetical protein n=1 Tax=Streptomyces sp. NPDC051636 TaxID=3365663 RepID=UPI00378919BF